jgi:hypothetical protein
LATLFAPSDPHRPQLPAPVKMRLAGSTRPEDTEPFTSYE